MKLRFEPRLMQEWVLQEARRDIAFRQQCHQRLEPVYELPEEERAEAFAVAYRQLFEEHRLGDGVKVVLLEFPILQDRIEEVLVLQALSRREEDVELSADRTRLGLRLRLQRLADPAQLAPFLQHELMRISDLLDEGFGYRADLTGFRNLSGLYRVLWDISIDGRLFRSGGVPEASREERLREFERTFSFLPARERRRAFEALWQADRVTHQQLLRWARDPVELARGAEGQRGGGESSPAPVLPCSSAPIPGSLCPLCRFPTYAWAEPAAEVIPLIQSDFPGWTPEDGLCERCCECYRLAKDEGMNGPISSFVFRPSS